jgi:VPDSG-CTERM motif
MKHPSGSVLLLPPMNTLRPILLAVTAAAAFSFAHPARANLITNPGFETGDFTGWTNLGGSVTGTFQGPTGPAVSPHSGSFQAAFGQTGISLSQNVTTTPGASYVVDFWLAGTDGGFFLASWGGTTIFSQNFFAGSGYTEHTFTVQASSLTTALLFHFDGVSAGHGILLDDVSVNPAVVGVPDAGSTLPLLGFASLGLAALRRKLGC